MSTKAKAFSRISYLQLKCLIALENVSVEFMEWKMQRILRRIMRKCDYPILCNRFSTLLRFSSTLTDDCFCRGVDITKLASMTIDFYSIDSLMGNFFSTLSAWRREERELKLRSRCTTYCCRFLFGNNKKRSLSNTHVHKFLKYIERQTWNAFTKFLILFVVFVDLKLQSHGLWWKRVEFLESKFGVKDVSITTCAWKRWLEL